MYDFEEVKGGTELFVNHLKSAFPDSENITFSKSKDEVRGPSLVRFNLEYPRMGVAISRHFARMHASSPFDIVLCNDIAGLGLKLLAPEVPVIQVFHYTYRGLAHGALQGRPGYWAARYMLPWFEDLTVNGKEVVVVSHKTRREMERLYHRSARVIENAVDLNKFKPLPQSDCRERLGIDWKGPMGIFVGRADHTKGFDLVQQLARQRRDLKILCVTGSPISDKDLIVARNVPNDDMPIYYSAADFLVFPSKYESASYTTLEALACDLPVVAHRTGIFEDIKEEKVGRIMDELDVGQFSMAIDQVLGSGELNTRRVAERRFSMDRFISEYRELAKSMVKGN